MTRYLTRKTERQSPHAIVRQLYRMREEKRITRMQLAVVIGWDDETLGRRERGDVSPTLQELEDWSAALGCHVHLALMQPAGRYRMAYDDHGVAFPAEEEVH